MSITSIGSAIERSLSNILKQLFVFEDRRYANNGVPELFQ
jgi:hypothetical protein